MKLSTFIHAKNKAIVSQKCIKEEIVHNRCHNCHGPMVDAWKKLRKTTWIKNETIKASFSDILSLRTDTCANMEGRGESEGKGSKESLLAAASVSVYTLKKQWWLLFKVGAMGPRGWSTGCKSEILCAMRSIILIFLLPKNNLSRLMVLVYQDK